MKYLGNSVLVVYNAKIRTLEHESEVYYAMSIRNGMITGLYKKDDQELQTLLAGVKRSIDIDGRTVLPGLVDSHAHFMTTAALGVFGCGISENTGGRLEPSNINGVLEKAQKFASGRKGRGPLLFSNVIAASLEERRLPNSAEIDSVFGGRIVGFMTTDGHSVSLSSAGLKAVGIDPSSTDGILAEDSPGFSFDKLTSVLMKNIGPASIIRGMRDLVNDALGYGITCIHAMDGMTGSLKNDISLRLLLLLAGRLPVRIRLYPQLRDSRDLDKANRRTSGFRAGGCGSWVVDGSVGAGTAAFYDDYINKPGCKGVILFPEEELDAAVEHVTKNAGQTSVHALGTAAIDHLLQAYRRIPDGGKKRLRIEHFEFPSDSAVDEVIRSGYVVVPQPGYSWMDSNYPGMNTYGKALSPEICGKQIPLRTLVEAGVAVCGSSDSPIQPMNPFVQIRGMIDFPVQSQKLTMFQALRCYTFNGCYATFEELQAGTLKVGKRADFTVLDTDPFEAGCVELEGIRSHAVFIDGRPVKPSGLPWFLWVLKLMFRGRKKI